MLDHHTISQLGRTRYNELLQEAEEKRRFAQASRLDKAQTGVRQNVGEYLIALGRWLQDHYPSETPSPMIRAGG